MIWSIFYVYVNEKKTHFKTNEKWPIMPVINVLKLVNYVIYVSKTDYKPKQLYLCVYDNQLIKNQLKKLY